MPKDPICATQPRPAPSDATMPAMGEASSAPLRYTPALDGVRALAVLSVIAFHTRGHWFPGGYIGVDIFFVLSGFLITRLLMDEQDRTGRASLPRFYLRRGLRLLPALVVVCAVVAAACLLLDVRGRDATLVGVVTAMLYVSSPFAAAGHNLGDMLPTWSLSVEEYFYLVWPAFLLYVVWRQRRRVALVVALCVAAVAYRAIVPAVAHWDGERISYAPDTRLEQLLIGVLLAFTLPAIAGRVRPWMAVVAATALAVFVIAPAGLSYQPYMHGLSTVIALLAAVVVAYAARPGQSWVGRILDSRPLVWVGKRSYGMYLWHIPLVSIVALLPVGGAAQVLLKTVLVVVVPALSFRFVERPFLRLKGRVADAVALGHAKGRRVSDVAVVKDPAGSV